MIKHYIRSVVSFISNWSLVAKKASDTIPVQKDGNVIGYVSTSVAEVFFTSKEKLDIVTIPGHGFQPKIINLRTVEEESFETIEVMVGRYPMRVLISKDRRIGGTYYSLRSEAGVDISPRFTDVKALDNWILDVFSERITGQIGFDLVEAIAKSSLMPHEI